MSTTLPGLLNPADEAQLQRLLDIREQLRQEKRQAMSPGVERALHVADVYLFLALGYYGYSTRLLPEQD